MLTTTKNSTRIYLDKEDARKLAVAIVNATNVREEKVIELLVSDSHEQDFPTKCSLTVIDNGKKLFHVAD